MTRPLTEADKREGFIRATGGFSGARARWAERTARGMSDAELSDALAMSWASLVAPPVRTCCPSPIKARA